MDNNTIPINLNLIQNQILRIHPNLQNQIPLVLQVHLNQIHLQTQINHDKKKKRMGKLRFHAEITLT